MADHLSRLDLKFILESLPLNESFPDEQLMSANIVPWFADIVNYLVTCQISEHWTKQDRTKFLSKVKTSFGMIPIYLNIVLIRLLDDVFSIMKFKVLSHFAMNKFVAATLVLKRQQQKFYSVVFIGLLFFS